MLRYEVELIGNGTTERIELRRAQRPARLGQLERCGRQLLDRPVMQQADQVTAFPGPKAAQDVQQVRPGRAGVGVVLRHGTRGRAKRAVIGHDRLLPRGRRRLSPSNNEPRQQSTR